MSRHEFENPPVSEDWARTTLNLRFIENVANGGSAIFTAPGGNRRPSVDRILEDAQRDLDLEGAEIIASARQVRDETGDLRHKFVYFDGRTEYGVRLIVGEQAVVSRSNTPYPSVTIQVPG